MKTVASFGRFFVIAAPFVFVATLLTIWMGARIFKITGFKTDEEKCQGAEQVSQFDEKEGIYSKSFFIFSSAMTVLFVLTIAFASMLPGLNKLGMAYVALLFAGIMMLRYKSEASQFYKNIDCFLSRSSSSFF